MYDKFTKSDGTQEEALYYLYMMADGEASQSEEKIFKVICKNLDLDKNTQKDVVIKCKEISDDIKIVNIPDALIRATHEWFKDDSKPFQARILWNLVDLGYANLEYSKEEEKIVIHLADKWDLEDVLNEFISAAKTILALSKQKNI